MGKYLGRIHFPTPEALDLAPVVAKLLKRRVSDLSRKVQKAKAKAKKIAKRK